MRRSAQEHEIWQAAGEIWTQYPKSRSSKLPLESPHLPPSSCSLLNLKSLFKVQFWHGLRETNFSWTEKLSFSGLWQKLKRAKIFGNARLVSKYGNFEKWKKKIWNRLKNLRVSRRFFLNQLPKVALFSNRRIKHQPFSVGNRTIILQKNSRFPRFEPRAAGNEVWTFPLRPLMSIKFEDSLTKSTIRQC